MPVPAAAAAPLAVVDTVALCSASAERLPPIESAAPLVLPMRAVVVTFEIEIAIAAAMAVLEETPASASVTIASSLDAAIVRSSAPVSVASSSRPAEVTSSTMFSAIEAPSPKPPPEVPVGSALTVLELSEVAVIDALPPVRMTVEPVRSRALVVVVSTCSAKEPAMTVPLEGETPELAMISKVAPDSLIASSTRLPALTVVVPM